MSKVLMQFHANFNNKIVILELKYSWILTQKLILTFQNEFINPFLWNNNKKYKIYKISSSDYLLILVISERLNTVYSWKEARETKRVAQISITKGANGEIERNERDSRISNDNRKQIVGERNGTSRLSDLAVSENAWSATLDGRAHVGWKCLVSRHEKL